MGGFRRSALPSVSAFAAGRVDLRAHDFRFSARTASELPLGGLVLLPSASELPLGELAFGLTASAFRHAPLRKLPSAGSFFRWAGWPSGSRLPLFGTHRFGVALGGLTFGLTASAFRHAPLRGCRWASWFFCLPLPLFGTHRFGVVLGELAFGLTPSAFRHAPLRGCRSASWPSGSRLPLFGTHRSAPPHRRREGRRSAPTRHLFHFKTLIPTC